MRSAFFFLSLPAGSSIGQQKPDFPAVGFGNEVRSAQRTFALGGFFGQNMAGAGFSIDNFPRAGHFKTLGSRTICFYFRHENTSLN
jgi:hypothetical protein